MIFRYPKKQKGMTIYGIWNFKGELWKGIGRRPTNYFAIIKRGENPELLIVQNDLKLYLSNQKLRCIFECWIKYFDIDLERDLQIKNIVGVLKHLEGLWKKETSLGYLIRRYKDLERCLK